MSLKEQVNKDIVTAMKSKDTNRLSVLRMLKAKFIEHETSAENKTVNDDVAISLIQNLIKQRKESAKLYEENKRPELAEKEKNEIEVLESYLPEFVSEEFIRSTVAEVIRASSASSPKDMGPVMGAVMSKLKASGALVDGALVQKIVKESLVN